MFIPMTEYHKKCVYKIKNLLVEYLGSGLALYQPALFRMLSWYDGRSPMLPMLPLQYPPIALWENWETACGMWYVVATVALWPMECCCMPV